MEIKLGKIKIGWLKNIFRKLWESPALILLILIIIDGIIGFSLFNDFYVKPKEKEPIITSFLRVDKSDMEDVAKEWDKRKQRFKETLSKKYSNPFKESRQKERSPKEEEK